MVHDAVLHRSHAGLAAKMLYVMTRRGKFWPPGRIGKTLAVVCVAFVGLIIVGAITDGFSGASSEANVAVPVSCLEDAQLSDAQGGTVSWFANHENPSYYVTVQRFPSTAAAHQAVEVAASMHTTQAQAGEYSVRGPVKLSYGGPQLTAADRAEAHALVGEVAKCLSQPHPD